ncbi:MAG: hypothetical protein ACE5IR_15080 [bacterium]
MFEELGRKVYFLSEGVPAERVLLRLCTQKPSARRLREVILDFPAKLRGQVRIARIARGRVEQSTTKRFLRQP